MLILFLTIFVIQSYGFRKTHFLESLKFFSKLRNFNDRYEPLNNNYNQNNTNKKNLYIVMGNDDSDLFKELLSNLKTSGLKYKPISISKHDLQITTPFIYENEKEISIFDLYYAITTSDFFRN
jgi:hypothetical protein